VPLRGHHVVFQIVAQMLSAYLSPSYDAGFDVVTGRTTIVICAVHRSVVSRGFIRATGTEGTVPIFMTAAEHAVRRVNILKYLISVTMRAKQPTLTRHVRKNSLLPVPTPSTTRSPEREQVLPVRVRDLFELFDPRAAERT
jgi:hypothetical protein